MLCFTPTNEPVSFDIYISRLSRFLRSVMKEGNDLRAAQGCHQPTVIIAVRTSNERRATKGGGERYDIDCG
jgi:hypothetical protein